MTATPSGIFCTLLYYYHRVYSTVDNIMHMQCFLCVVCSAHSLCRPRVSSGSYCVKAEPEWHRSFISVNPSLLTVGTQHTALISLSYVCEWHHRQLPSTNMKPLAIHLQPGANCSGSERGCDFHSECTILNWSLLSNWGLKINVTEEPVLPFFPTSELLAIRHFNTETREAGSNICTTCRKGSDYRLLSFSACRGTPCSF